jgi:hypothetical protein
MIDLNSEQALRDAILDCFASLAPADSADPRKIESIAIDADWVALRLAGMPLETRIDSLPVRERIALKSSAERVRGAGADMVSDGLLQRFDVTFANQGKNQKINPYPPGMFMLTLRGCAEVLGRQAKLEEKA